MVRMVRIIFATKNKDKIKEIVNFFSDLKQVKWLSFNDFDSFPDVIEDSDTIEGNSIKKAVEVADYFKIPALADDSGLFVDWLGGSPGVYSSRWAGPGCSYKDNNIKLLESLKGVKWEDRTATFRCAVTLAFPDGKYITEVGEVSGYILNEMKGDKGFGYDPLFWVPNLNKTFAEMDIEEKNRISHRFRALEKIKPHIYKIFNI